MLYSLMGLLTCTMVTADGARAALREAYVDTRHWTVRHWVAEVPSAHAPQTMLWVLVPPEAVRAVSIARRRIELNWHRAQLLHAPGAQTDPPCERAVRAEQLHPDGDVSWDQVLRWGLPDMPLGGALTSFVLPEEATAYAHPRSLPVAAPDPPKADGHLHSSADLVGYSACAPDGPVGFVQDLLLDGPVRQVEWLVVDTRPGTSARGLLVPAHAAVRVDADQAQVEFALSRQSIHASPTLSRATLRERTAPPAV